MDRAKAKTLRLWTLQPVQVWLSLQQSGSLFVDPALRKLDPEYQEAYAWMRGQMGRRIPAYQGHDPWWAYDYPPDLRHYRYRAGEPGSQQVRLALSVPRERVLLSAYGDWHHVLSGDYLPPSQNPDKRLQESEAWERQFEALITAGEAPRITETSRTLLEESWERIFDVEELRNTNTIQATFERLDLLDVVSVTEFTVAATKLRRW